MAERTCSVEGCTRKHVARGFCSTHYNQTFYTADQRHAKVTVPCDWCTNPCTKEQGRAKRYGGLFCSYPCRDAWRIKHGYVITPDIAAMGRAAARASAKRRIPSRRSLAKAKMKRAARGTKGTRWVAGTCVCGYRFVASFAASLAEYCSDQCKSRARNSRRRARERSAEHVSYSRQYIFERDQWRCHLCRRKVKRTAVVPHPLAPVIDHLIPLGPDGPDAAHNVACAHFLCNSIKRDKGGGEQLALIG